MAFTQPGTYVLYHERGGNGLAWPGVTVPDDIAPHRVQQERPSGYMTLVLLLGTTYRLQWATTSQLSSFVPISKNAQDTMPEELLQAYHVADFGLDACLTLDYWREEVSAQFSDETLPAYDTGPDPECFDIDCEEEETRQIQAAIRNSRKDIRDMRSKAFPTPSFSPPERGSKRRRPDPIEISDDDSGDDEDSLYSFLPETTTTTIPSYPLCSGNSVLGKGRTSSSTRKTPSARCNNIGSSTKATSSQAHLTGPGGFDRLLRRPQSSAAPTSDNIDGDIHESKDFVRIAVGPDGEVRTLLKIHVWDRPYFRDPLSGIERFKFNEADGTYEVEYPELSKLDPADFQFLAEYWTDGDFGVRNPEGPDETKEAIAQCVSAWEAADKLGMFDLLEHIVGKIQFYEWENADVLILAVIIYRSPHEPTEAHQNMRNWISSYLAQHFWTYVRDETMGHLFRRKLKALPELEREVFEKRAVILAAGEDMSDDEGGDDDEL